MPVLVAEEASNAIASRIGICLALASRADHSPGIKDQARDIPRAKTRKIAFCWSIAVWRGAPAPGLFTRLLADLSKTRFPIFLILMKKGTLS